jgi:hypothetical protein
MLTAVKEDANLAVLSEDGDSKVLNYTMNYLPIYTTSPPEGP